MKLIVQEKASEAYFRGAGYGCSLYASVQTARGILLCYRDGAPQRMVLLHIGFELEELGRWVLNEADQMVTTANLISVPEIEGVMWLAVDVRDEYHYKALDSESVDAMVVASHLRWYLVRITSAGELEVSLHAEWVDDYVDQISAVQAGGELHWLARRRHIPRNRQEVTDWQTISDLKPELLYARTNGDRIPVFRSLEAGDLPLHSARDFHALGMEDGRIIFAFVAGFKELFVCNLLLATLSIEAIPWKIRGQTGGEKVLLGLLRDPGGTMHLFWYYSNGKLSREKRDRGYWHAQFRNPKEKVKPIRIHEDRESCWLNHQLIQMDPDNCLLFWTNGFTKKTAQFRVVRWNLTSGASKVGFIASNPDVQHPTGGFTLGERVYLIGDDHLNNTLWECRFD